LPLKNIITGVATNIEEYVPDKIPTIKANDNPLKLPPPKINKEISTNNVVRDVIIVLLNV
jgi:hypothetical protein